MGLPIDLICGRLVPRPTASPAKWRARKEAMRITENTFRNLAAPHLVHVRPSALRNPGGGTRSRLVNGFGGWNGLGWKRSKPKCYERPGGRPIWDAPRTVKKRGRRGMAAACLSPASDFHDLWPGDAIPGPGRRETSCDSCAKARHSGNTQAGGSGGDRASTLGLPVGRGSLCSITRWWRGTPAVYTRLKGPAFRGRKAVSTGFPSGYNDSLEPACRYREKNRTSLGARRRRKDFFFFFPDRTFIVSKGGKCFSAETWQAPTMRSRPLPAKSAGDAHLKTILPTARLGYAYQLSFGARPRLHRWPGADFSKNLPTGKEGLSRHPSPVGTGDGRQFATYLFLCDRTEASDRLQNPRAESRSAKQASNWLFLMKERAGSANPCWKPAPVPFFLAPAPH